MTDVGDQGLLVTCAVCENTLRVTWTDTHGVGACVTCGLPYRILHYEKSDNGKDRRIDKPPEVTIRDESIALGRAYWAETKRRVFPGEFDFGFLSGRTYSYSGATIDDAESWNEWCAAHPELMPEFSEAVCDEGE